MICDGSIAYAIFPNMDIFIYFEIPMKHTIGNAKKQLNTWTWISRKNTNLEISIWKS